MSEYLSKKAVLGWLESEMSINKGHPDDIDIHWTLNRVSKKILSGAFDAPEMEHINAYWAREGLIKHQEAEVQRLRAELVKARAVMEDALSVGEATYEDFDIKLNPWADLSMGVEEINKTLY